MVEKHRIIEDHAGGSPKLDAAAAGVVHQKDKGFRVFGKVAQSDVLAIAAEVGEAECVFIDDLQKARRTAADAA